MPRASYNLYDLNKALTEYKKSFSEYTKNKKKKFPEKIPNPLFNLEYIKITSSQQCEMVIKSYLEINKQGQLHNYWPRLGSSHLLPLEGSEFLYCHLSFEIFNIFYNTAEDLVKDFRKDRDKCLSKKNIVAQYFSEGEFDMLIEMFMATLYSFKNQIILNLYNKKNVTMNSTPLNSAMPTPGWINSRVMRAHFLKEADHTIPFLQKKIEDILKKIPASNQFITYDIQSADQSINSLKLKNVFNDPFLPCGIVIKSTNIKQIEDTLIFLSNQVICNIKLSELLPLYVQMGSKQKEIFHIPWHPHKNIPFPKFIPNQSNSNMQPLILKNKNDIFNYPLNSENYYLPYCMQRDVYLKMKSHQSLYVKQKCAEVIQRIKEKLSDKAQTIFKMLFEPCPIGDISEFFIYVSGDCDGSITRVILICIHALYILPTERGIQILVELMNAEAEAIDKANAADSDREIHFLRFQINVRLQNLLEELLGELKFFASYILIVFIGDIVHDRFSLNKIITRILLTILRRYGVIFICGNHDLYQYGMHSQETRRQFFQAYMPYNDVLFTKFKADQKPQFQKELVSCIQFGGFSKDDLDLEKWKQHDQEVFMKVFLHSATKTIFVHNGMCIEEEQTVFSLPKIIKTAFGDFAFLNKNNQFDLKTLIKEINTSSYEDLVPNIESDQNKLKTVTDFRPKLKEIKNFLDSIKRNFSTTMKENKIRLVYGHDGAFLNGLAPEEITDVVPTNPRWQEEVSGGKKDFYTAVLIQLGTQNTLPYGADDFLT